MSLVAYDASSDDDSDCEDNSFPIITKTLGAESSQSPQVKTGGFSNGDITDEDDAILDIKDKEKYPISTLAKILPKPKNVKNLTDSVGNLEKPTFSVLPTPKMVSTQGNIVEDDDEFLHKKPNAQIIEKRNNIEVKKMPVKIMVPSLKSFQDVEKEMTDKAKNRNVNDNSTSSKTSGLLSILPRAKSEQNFAKVMDTKVKPPIPYFVPDTVKHKRPATNTEDGDKLKVTKKTPNKASKMLAGNNKQADTDESDDDSNDPIDFFSFNSDQILPDVSATEINALVTKKAAQIVETSINYLKANTSQHSNNVREIDMDAENLELSRNRNQEQSQINAEALQALVGNSAKRRRQQQSAIQVIDINSSEVLPNRDEWMRTTLASSTTYQPTGVLVDEEPASGTRRKHQITYLAHKAKANEAELQAMWAANRQNRRVTQSKYGF